MSKTLQETIREVQDKIIEAQTRSDEMCPCCLKSQIENAVLAGVEWAKKDTVEKLKETIEILLDQDEHHSHRLIDGIKHAITNIEALTNTDK